MSRSIKPLARQIIAQLPADHGEAMRILAYVMKALQAEPDEVVVKTAILKVVEKG